MVKLKLQLKVEVQNGRRNKFQRYIFLIYLFFYEYNFKNLTKTYKFTASYAGDANYADENAVCTVSVTKKSSSSGGGSSSYKAYDVTIGSSDNGIVKSSTSKISPLGSITLARPPVAMTFIFGRFSFSFSCSMIYFVCPICPSTKPA